LYPNRTGPVGAFATGEGSQEAPLPSVDAIQDG